MVVTNEEIMEGFQGEQDLQNLADKVKTENVEGNYKQVVETIQDLFQQEGQSKQKYFAMKLMMLLSKKQLFINSFIKAKNLFDILGELAMCDYQKPYEQRGFKIFGAQEDQFYSQGFYDLLMECISYWGTKYATDQKGNPTKFGRLLEKLTNQGLKPKVDLQHFELTEEQIEKLKSFSMPTEQQKLKSNMNDYSLEELKKMYQEMFSQTNDLVESLEQNLKGEDQATEIMDQLMENAYNDAEKLKPNLELLHARQSELGEGQRKQIGYRFKIISTLIEAHKAMRAEGFTNESYQIFRYEVLQATREITGSEKPKPPANYGKPPQQQPNPQPDIKVQTQQIQKPPQQPDKRQAQQPQPYQSKYPPAKEQPYQSKYPPGKEHEIQKTIQQSVPYNPQNQPNYQPQTYARNPQPQQQQYQQPKQQKQPYYQPSQPYQQPEKHVQQPPPFKKLPIARSYDFHQSPNKDQFFEDNYDNKSQSSQQTGKEFYLKGQLGLEQQVYEGEFIPYDDRNFTIFEEIYNSNSGISRIKRANLKSRYSIFESLDIQIGFDSNLIYHEITNRFYLRIRLCVGNKTQQILQNVQYQFEGDTCMGLWTQEPIYQHSHTIQTDQLGRLILNPKQQIYIPICINYNRVPYQVISGRISYEIAYEEEGRISHFILPCLLTKFMSFRDTTIDSFLARWEYKSKSILKSEQVRLNQKIVNSRDDILKHFGPNNVLILHGEEDMLTSDANQMQKKTEMVGSEYGLVFTLSSPQIEFLLKIILFPNQTVLFQIIPYSSYQTQAEAILHTLVFLFGLPD
ncbi:unnamed protein product (macronuclear) [Paramecium tetraurelia]|uniref:Clathrin adaptor alpha/beta/gamma-adaptin appendage Ig-like subdomain domain-containing protein n=1 Tax=Paramecium tetraurelia TaxID=5888 RepID=A0D466_PARTE|nr:uncharacterized protein GSPATT00013299001 [Paramecium tetraurelia]CAK77833.1 unnamed protein product [Paramecium tetraurelia]|eukprot:XP_001445230.1 hypothetical protein (macronuclear) [Paramecium tetraurelia strain d4-2]